MNVETPNLDQDEEEQIQKTQIVAILREHEAGKKVADLCREHGVSQPTFYQWKAKYSGLDANQLKEFKELKMKYARLEKMYTEAQMDRQVLKEIIEGKL
ncbi:MAG: transposase [Flavobacteriales bacterium]|nr:transposase [Flavobacteriales bacterium]